MFFYIYKIEIIKLKVSLVNIVNMSDDESYYSDSDESLDEQPTKKNPLLNKFGKYNDDEEIDDSEPDIDDKSGGADEDEDDDDDMKGEKDLKDDDNDGESLDYPEDDDDDDDDDDDNDVEEPEAKNTKPKKNVKVPLEIIDEDDDEDEYEENYLQKFDHEVNKNYIYEFHPECLNHNSDEVAKLARVIRDSNNIIIDPLHRTLPYLTKYEKARVLGQRAKQIESGAKPLVKVPDNIIDGYLIAELELREKKIPFIIKRPIPGGAFEYWYLKDLENIHF